MGSFDVGAVELESLQRIVQTLHGDRTERPELEWVAERLRDSLAHHDPPWAGDLHQPCGDVDLATRDAIGAPGRAPERPGADPPERRTDLDRADPADVGVAPRQLEELQGRRAGPRRVIFVRRRRAEDDREVAAFVADGHVHERALVAGQDVLDASHERVERRDRPGRT